MSGRFFLVGSVEEARRPRIRSAVEVNTCVTWEESRRKEEGRDYSDYRQFSDPPTFSWMSMNSAVQSAGGVAGISNEHMHCRAARGGHVQWNNTATTQQWGVPTCLLLGVPFQAFLETVKTHPGLRLTLRVWLHETIVVTNI